MDIIENKRNKKKDENNSREFKEKKGKRIEMKRKKRA